MLALVFIHVWQCWNYLSSLPWDDYEITAGPYDTRFYYRHRKFPALYIACKTNTAVHIRFWSGTEHRALRVIISLYV